MRACLAFAEAENRDGRYLFRGEGSDVYGTTLSMDARVEGDRRLPERARRDIRDAAGRLQRDLREFLQLDQDLATGFVQHYEAPTRMLDLTSSLDVAGVFASAGLPGTCGLLGLVPRDIRGNVRIVDLTRHPRALRPRLQHAFGFFSDTITDLKARTALDSGVRWLRFIHSDDDWAPTPGYAASLMDAHRDPVAGVIQFLLDSYPKWNDWTAKWLAEHVAPAPFIMRPVPGGGVAGLEYELVSASDAGLTFDLEVERFNNHRIWSNAYPDSRAVPAFENLRAVLTT